MTNASTRTMGSILSTCLVGAVTLTASTLTARVASADDDPFEVRWELDVPLGAAAALAGGSMHLLQDELVAERCGLDCDPNRVNAFDATTLGTYSEAASIGGNVLVTANVVLGPTVALISAIDADHPDRFMHFAEDVTLLGQTLGLSVFVHQLTAFATQRPRPYVYASSLSPALRDDANSYLSFYSGHTANGFAVATATSYLFMRRNPESPWVVPLWTMSHGLAALQGYLRVASGFHYWSDVLVGAAMGSALGLAVPWLHELPDSEIALTPMPLRGGAALAVSWHR